MSFTVQIREADSTDIDSTRTFGQFTSPLTNTIFLEDGDSISVSQAYLDQNNTGKINVTNDNPTEDSVSVVITYGIYLTNTLQSSRLTLEEWKGQAGDLATIPEGPDYADYVVCFKTAASTTFKATATAATTQKVITHAVDRDANIVVGMTVRNDESILVGIIESLTPTSVTLKNNLNVEVTDGAILSVRWEGATIIYLDRVEFEENGYSYSQPFEIFYTDENNVKKTYSDRLSNYNATKESHYVTIGVKCVKGSVTYERSRDLDFRGFFFKDLPEVQSKHTDLTPELASTTIKIKKGLYAPAEIATIISDKLQEGVVEGVLTGDSNIDNTKDMFTSKMYTNGALIASKQLMLVADKRIGTPVASQLANSNFGIGANTAGMSFNVQNSGGKFAWDQLHSPLTKDATTMCNMIGTEGNTATGQLKIASRAGGMFITNFEPKELFEQMGFRSADLQTFDTSGLMYNKPASTVQESMTHVVFNDFDKHTTKLFSGLDWLQVGDKISGNTLTKSVGAVNAPLFVTGTEIEKLYATSSIETDAPPYLQIEITGIPCVGYSTTDSTRNIGAIVGNYYSDGRYTSLAESGLPYLHTGQPIQISSLSVTVRSDTGAIAQTGGNSSIVLQVIKAIKQKK